MAVSPETKAYLKSAAERIYEPKAFDFLRHGKEDRTFGRKDSKEYINMHDSVHIVQAIILNTQKLYQLCGYAPHTPLKDGLKEEVRRILEERK